MKLQKPEEAELTLTVDEKKDTEQHEKKPSAFGTRRQKMVLISIALYWFTVSCAYSMIAPFFPGEAKTRGSSAIITGLIFVAFPLTLFIFSPVVGIVLPLIGPKSTLMLGLFIEGSSQVLFGFLDLLPNGRIFIAGCFAVRIVCALGASATTTASLTLLVQNFHENISPAQGVMETFYGVGMMAGPPIGGFLYTVGGFKLPFLVLGIIILCSLIPMCCVLPSDKEKKKEEINKGALWQAIRIPAVAIVALLTAVAAMVLSFLEPSLQNHLLPFHLNSSQIGLMFLITPAIYALTAPGVGYIADKKDRRVIMMIGGIIMALGYLLLGPMPIFRGAIPSTLWLNGVSLALVGIGAGPFIVPGISDMSASTVKYGMADDTSTHSALASIFNAMMNMGAIAGPTVGGILIFGFYIFLWTAVLAIFTIYERRGTREQQDNEETTPMLFE